MEIEIKQMSNGVKEKKNPIAITIDKKGGENACYNEMLTNVFRMNQQKKSIKQTQQRNNSREELTPN